MAKLSNKSPLNDQPPLNSHLLLPQTRLNGCSFYYCNRSRIISLLSTVDNSAKACLLIIYSVQSYFTLNEYIARFITYVCFVLQSLLALNLLHGVLFEVHLYNVWILLLISSSYLLHQLSPTQVCEFFPAIPLMLILQLFWK